MGVRLASLSSTLISAACHVHGTPVLATVEKDTVKQVLPELDVFVPDM